ncbi:MAG: MFS transporter [Oscillospiraceae bacterium]|nr:MFS transporter [Oscillospiraceae bacterium]
MAQSQAPAAPGAAVSDYKMPKSFPYIWAMNSIGQGYGIGIYGYMLMFWQDISGLTPVFVAQFLFIARLIDLVASVAAGPVVQNTNTRFGQFRPWVLICPISSSIGQILMFLYTGNFPMGVRAVIAVISYVMLHFPMNFITAAQNGLMLKVVGSDMEGRMTLPIIVSRFTSANGIISASITLPLITYLNTKIYPHGFIVVCCIYACLWLTTTTLVLRATKEFDKQLDEFQRPAKRQGIAAMYGYILKNREAMLLLCTSFVSQVYMYSLGNMGTMYWIYSVGGVLNPDGTQKYIWTTIQPIVTVSGNITGLFTAMFIAPIGRKLGRRKAYITNVLLGLVGTISHALFSNARPWVYLGISIYARLAMGIGTSVGNNMMIDAAERQRYETGIDIRAATMSITSIAMKVAMLVGTVFTPFFMNLVGYGQRFAEDGTFLGAFCEYPERINLIQQGGSACITIMNFTLFLLLYRIRDDTAVFYATENQKRMVEAQQAAAAAAGGGPGGPPAGGGPGGPPAGGGAPPAGGGAPPAGGGAPPAGGR